MEYPPLIRGRILRRYQRFLADIELESGRVVTAHCANTGSMTSCWSPGAPAEISRSDNFKRKLPWTLERVDMGRGWVGVNTARINAVIAEGIHRGRIPELRGYTGIRCEPSIEVPGHRRSRFDLLLTGCSGQPVYVEIKNTTLLIGDAVQFPDAVTERGRKHLDLLAAALERGFRSVMLFAVNRPEGVHFQPASEIDPGYARRLKEVAARGVEVLAVRIRQGTSSADIAQPDPSVPVRL